nr:CHAD domain-containing protein [uncultured Sphaerochaeta sp.]
MNNKGPYYLLFETQSAPETWEHLFTPYRILWKQASIPLEGTLFLDEQPVGEVRYFPEELRLELFPLPGSQDQTEGLLAVSAFREMCNSPIIGWCEKQVAVFSEHAANLEDMNSLHAFRTAICNLRLMVPLICAGLSKEKRKEIKQLLKRLVKYAGKVRDDQVLIQLLEEKGLEEEKKHLKMERHLSDLKEALPASFASDIRQLLEENRFAFSGYHPKVMVAKVHRRLVKAVHKVHSARDVKAMHKVRRRVRSLLAVSGMASVKQDKRLYELEKILGKWHDLILLQDLLLKQKKPPIEALRVLVDVEKEVQHLVGEYRHLSSEYWEEMT